MSNSIEILIDQESVSEVSFKLATLDFLNKKGLEKEFETFFKDFIGVKEDENFPECIGLASTLNAMEEDDELKAYIVEIGVFNAEQDTNTAYDDYSVMVASCNEKSATLDAISKAKDEIELNHNDFFDVISGPEEHEF